MKDNSIEVLINELIDDLKLKIENISRIAQSDDLNIQNRLLEIRNKVINVLFAASDKLNDACGNYDDIEDLYKSIEIVKNKSNSLYDEAVKRILDLKGDEKAPVKEEEIKISEEVVIEKPSMQENNEVYEEKIEDHVEQIDTVDEKVSEIALDTLKGWLLPKGDE